MIKNHLSIPIAILLLTGATPSHAANDKGLGKYDISFTLNNKPYNDSIVIDQYLGDNKYSGHIIGGLNVTGYKSKKLFCINATNAVILSESWCLELRSSKTLTASYIGTVSDHCTASTPVYTSVTVPAVAKKVRESRRDNHFEGAAIRNSEPTSIRDERYLLQKASDLTNSTITAQ